MTRILESEEWAGNRTGYDSRHELRQVDYHKRNSVVCIVSEAANVLAKEYGIFNGVPLDTILKCVYAFLQLRVRMSCAIFLNAIFIP